MVRIVWGGIQSFWNKSTSWESLTHGVPVSGRSPSPSSDTSRLSASSIDSVVDFSRQRNTNLGAFGGAIGRGGRGGIGGTIVFGDSDVIDLVSVNRRVILLNCFRQHVGWNSIFGVIFSCLLVSL